MSTFGYLFVLAGALLIRQVVTGRVKETPGDFKALTLSLLNADVEGIRGVVSQRGENVPVSAVGTGSATADTGTSPAPTFAEFTGLIAEMKRLGNSAKGYVWGASGPTYYDCSGLVWKALVNLGIYSGPRFTTKTFRNVAANFASPISSVQTPAVGDIVLWEGHHIGVLVGPDTLYSARSPAKGIGTSSVSGDSKYFRSNPTYWRLTRG